MTAAEREFLVNTICTVGPISVADGDDLIDTRLSASVADTKKDLPLQEPRRLRVPASAADQQPAAPPRTLHGAAPYPDPP